MERVRKLPTGYSRVRRLYQKTRDANETAASFNLLMPLTTKHPIFVDSPFVSQNGDQLLMSSR
ncbi:hypothetical protein AGR6A_Lc80030 [Agrobacterium sp. NCPPB 925]|nr:hypothetical protein AGR6A_Lc80030 [Agrobacterium sp. NCPPB 925]